MAALSIAIMARIDQSKALWVVGVLDLLATIHFVRGSIFNLSRMGLGGLARARWWIEVAALDFTLCVSCLVFLVTRLLGKNLTPLEQQTSQTRNGRPPQIPLPKREGDKSGAVTGGQERA